jgi:endonuclease G|nr:trypsin-like serine protease [Kofleriaceae bacterium]
MRRALGVASALAAARVAAASPDVIGGSDAPPGMWPDAAAILFSGTMECSGVLVAPTVVLTAGHCADPALGPQPDHVRVGASSLTGSDGETLAVATATVFPSYATTTDLTVLVLATAAREQPRAIATGWGSAAIVDGAPVELVGYGAIDADGSDFVPALQQAQTTITDATCAHEPGCSAGAMPAGELGAGGSGVDTCPGDSGGPMYLPTPFGTFVAGLTARAYATAQTACGGGGIYERPDHVVDWIELAAGGAVARGPEASVDAPIELARGGSGAVVTIAANDPVSARHRFAIAAQPAHGTAAVHDDGALHVCASGSYAGSDAVAVRITDAGASGRAITATFPIAIADRDDAGTCDAADFDGASDGGCCDAGAGGSPAASISLGLAALALARARRRR